MQSNLSSKVGRETYMPRISPGPISFILRCCHGKIRSSANRLPNCCANNKNCRNERVCQFLGLEKIKKSFLHRFAKLVPLWNRRRIIWFQLEPVPKCSFGSFSGSNWNRRNKIWFQLEPEKQNLVP